MGIKHLIQENPNMDLNLVRLISKLDPSKTNKLTPFMIKVFKKRIVDFEKDLSQVEGGLYGSRYEYVNGKMSDVSGTEKFIMTWVIDQFRAENIEILKEFSEVLDKGLVDQNDISKYENFEEITNQLSVARTKDLLKKSRKEISVVYEDDEIMMLKPLSFEASLKYGAGTKWCTAMKNEPEYFYRYSKNGILIYLINKETGRKFGCHSERFDNNRVQIFNEIDQVIDSFHMGLPYEKLTILMDLMDSEKYGVNSDLFSEEEKSKYGLRVNIYPVDEPMAMVDELMGIPNEEIPMDEGMMAERQEIPRLIPRLNRFRTAPVLEMGILEAPMMEKEGPSEIEHNIPEPDDRMLMRKIQKEIDDLMVLDRAGAFAHLENEEGDTLPGLDHEVEERG
jgi:hypothetical protein